MISVSHLIWPDECAHACFNAMARPGIHLSDEATHTPCLARLLECRHHIEIFCEN